MSQKHTSPTATSVASGPAHAGAERFASGEHTEGPVPCRSLRTKMLYISEALGYQYLQRTLPTEPYWCAQTQNATGLDDQPVEPDDCRHHRACYQAWDGPILDQARSFEVG